MQCRDWKRYEKAKCRVGIVKLGKWCLADSVPIVFRNLSALFIHPRFIAFLNLLLVLNLSHAVLELALEERYKIREIFQLLPKKRSEISYQNAVDENCHRFGLGFLLLGLFAEVGAECVSVPDRIINTSGLDDAVLFASGMLLVVCSLMMLTQSIMLLFAKRDWLIRRYQKTSQH